MLRRADSTRSAEARASITQLGTWRPGGGQSITLLLLLHVTLENELSARKSHQQPGVKHASHLPKTDTAKRRVIMAWKYEYSNVFRNSHTKGIE